MTPDAAAVAAWLKRAMLEGEPRWRVRWDTPALARAARRWGTARLLRHRPPEGSTP
jgi:hypothetical protein